MLTATSAAQVATLALEAAVNITRADRALVLVHDAKKDLLVPMATHGFPASDVAPPHTAPFTQHLTSNLKSLRLHADTPHALWQHRDPNVHSILALPLER